MNDIKLRAWNHVTKKMVYGPTGDQVSPSWILVMCQVDGIDPMLGTGKKDAKNQDIYAGDLILIDGRRLCEVVWHDYTAGFDLKYISDTGKETFKGCPFGEINRRGVIQGNIYANLDLIKK